MFQADWDELSYAVAFRLGQESASWFWHVRWMNRGRAPVDVDAVLTQDVALAPTSAVRNNEFYVSQYLDLTPVPVPRHGTALAVRQNMPGPTAPWCLVGSLDEGAAWATDLRQLTGTGLAEGADWPGLRADLPSTRLQHEHTVAAVQSRALTLDPDGCATTGFFGTVVAHHPAASGAADGQRAFVALHDPAATPPPALVSSIEHPADPSTSAATTAPAISGGAEDRVDGVDLFAAASLPVRDLTQAEWSRLCPQPRRHEEIVDGDVVAFFTEAGTHVVTAAKQEAVLRPHGHILRAGTRLLPDERDVTTTVWMDGSFCTHLSQGHVGDGVIVSQRRGYLASQRNHGVRVFVRFAQHEPWRLLARPSAWAVDLNRCRWWYAHDEGLIEVTTSVGAAPDNYAVDIKGLDGPAAEFLVTVLLSWRDAESQLGKVVRTPTGLQILAPSSSLAARHDDQAGLEVHWDGESVGIGLPGDASDEEGPKPPLLTLRTGSRGGGRLTFAPRLHRPVERERSANEVERVLARLCRVARLSPPATADGHCVAQIDTIMPWFAYNAAVHYLSPRGLEQHAGGGWGTRDVCQGPVGLLRSLGAEAELRELLLLIMRAQNVRGDWPQAFNFLPGYEHRGQTAAHGDVIYWPLLALGQYLNDTGDDSVLDAVAPAVGHDGPTPPTPVREHVRAALDRIEDSLISGTDLPAYGHGDWNDSLQPVDADLAAHMCSAWTLILQAQTMSCLATALAGSAPDLAGRARKLADGSRQAVVHDLTVDGTLTGYLVLGEDGTRETLLHPLDTRTGLHYSLLAMVHAIAAELLDPETASSHLDLIRQHLTAPDGVRLFDCPVDYRGGPMTLFQRAEASSFFGREIGLMYTHAHLRYAEALARVGDGPGLLHALALAQPIGITDRIPSARPRQSNCYASSSDAAFDDRYQAARDYGRLSTGEVAVEAGWRVYSSGPGLFVQLVVQHLLGIRVGASRVEFDPVLTPGLDGLEATVPILDRQVTVRFHVGQQGYGPLRVLADGQPLPAERAANRYRIGGLAIARDTLEDALASVNTVDVEVA